MCNEDFDLQFTSIDHLWPHNFINLHIHTEKIHVYRNDSLQLCFRYKKLFNGGIKEREIPHLLAILRFGSLSASGLCCINLTDDLKVLSCFWLLSLGHTIRTWKQWKTCPNIDHNDLYHQVLMFLWSRDDYNHHHYEEMSEFKLSSD